MAKYKHKRTGAIVSNEETLYHNFISLTENTLTGKVTKHEIPAWMIVGSYDWEEVKAPLLTTDDGVDKFIGETVYIINPSYTLIVYPRLSEYSRRLKGYHYFHEKQNAEIFVQSNLPIFSLKNVEIAAGCIGLPNFMIESLCSKLRNHKDNEKVSKNL